MNSEELTAWLEQHLPGRVTPVLNWGGFVNYSFLVDDGAGRYHLKLTDDAGIIQGLRRWHTVHEVLERRYRAPKLIRRIDFSEIGFEGLMFEHLDARTANFSGDLPLVEKLVDLAGRLHKDEDLPPHLSFAGAAQTCLDHFVATYIGRFTADLEAIEAGQLPFVSPSLRAWMRDETARLREAASRVAAFRQPAIAAVHGDLHEGNVLVTANDWYIVDWDDLALGDPCIDFAVLLWPIVWNGGEWRTFFRTELENGFVERMEVCFRAQLLDEVIDPLADYVGAHRLPSHQDAVRIAKRQRHEEALEKYKKKF